MNQKRKILVYVFDGFADHEVSHILAQISRSNQYKIKTVAVDKVLIKSMSGLSVMPDIDFIPHVDLADIESLNTAMLILPAGSTWKQKQHTEVLSLLNHCIENGIPVAMMQERMLINTMSNLPETRNQKVHTSSLSTLAKNILDVLKVDMIISPDRAMSLS